MIRPMIEHNVAQSGRTRLLWLGLIVVFLLALVPRVGTPSSRYLLWYERSLSFWEAIREGQLEETYQRYHPGVTTMWAAGLGLEAYRLTTGTPAGALPPAEEVGPQGAAAQAGVVAIGLVIAASIVAATWLLTRLTSWAVAMSAGVFLALDPFYLTHSKMIHVDGFLASFMLVSALALIVYARGGGLRYLSVSGVAGGLALLTKSPAWFLLPYAGLVAFVSAVVMVRRQPAGSPRRLSQPLLHFAVTVSGWGLLAAITAFFLWPVLWVAPETAVSGILEGARLHAESAHPAPQFFAGELHDGDPGVVYYLATLGWKTTLVTLPGAAAALVLLLAGRGGAKKERVSWWYLALFAGAFVLMMSLAAKKWGRYLLPAFVAIDVLAAWALVTLAQIAAGKVRPRGRRRLAQILVGGVLILQAGLVLRHTPYFGAHHNLLLGGSSAAGRVLPIGEQGEGLDLAAAYLNGKRGAERLDVAVQDPVNLMFSSRFAGETAPFGTAGTDFALFATHYNQRGVFVPPQDRQLWAACRQEGAERVVSLDGVPYVWICRAYPQDLQAFAVDQRRQARLGDHVILSGLRVEPETELPAGGSLTVTLFWKSDGRITGDYHVFVHLLGPDGQLVTQHDSVPANGSRPTWSWLADEVVVDEHTLEVPASLAPGPYTLSAGMYDIADLQRLPAVGDMGEPLPENRVELRRYPVEEGGGGP